MSVMCSRAGIKDEEVRRQESGDCHRDEGGQDGCQGDLLQHPPAGALLRLCRGEAEKGHKVFKCKVYSQIRIFPGLKEEPFGSKEAMEA